MLRLVTKTFASFTTGLKLGFETAKAKSSVSTRMFFPEKMTTPAGNSVDVYYDDELYLAYANNKGYFYGAIAVVHPSIGNAIVMSERFKGNSFVLHHEMAHIDLGHLKNPGLLSSLSAELEADEYAYRLVGDNEDDVFALLDYLSEIRDFNPKEFQARIDAILAMMKNTLAYKAA